MGALYLYGQGIWYEYFDAQHYGALIVTAHVDKGYKEPDEVFFRPVLYREEGSGIARACPASISAWRGHLPPRRGELRHLLPQAVPAGRRYRLKASLEGQLFWISFALDPRAVQRKTLSTLEARRITVRLLNAPSPPLSVRYPGRRCGQRRRHHGPGARVGAPQRHLAAPLLTPHGGSFARPLVSIPGPGERLHPGAVRPRHQSLPVPPHAGGQFKEIQMTTLARKLIILALGLLGGIAAWPLAELILYYQAGFPSYLAFLALLGAAVGLIDGGVLRSR